MVGQIISVNAKFGKRLDFDELVEKVAIPAARQYAGFHHWCQLSDPQTRKLVSVVVWGNESDMHAFDKQEMPHIVSQMRTLLDVDTMKVETFHVDTFAEAVPSMAMDQISDAILATA